MGLKAEGRRRQPQYCPFLVVVWVSYIDKTHKLDWPVRT